MRYTPNGRPVTQFSVAVNQSTKNQQTGEWIEETDWFRVSVWGDRAERAAEQPAQGQPRLRRGPLPDPRVRGPGRPEADLARDHRRQRHQPRRPRRDEEGGSFGASPRPRGGRCAAGGRRRAGVRRRPARPAAAARRHRPRRPSLLTTLPRPDAARRVSPHHQETRPCPPARRSATTSTAIDAAARSARSAPTRRSQIDYKEVNRLRRYLSERAKIEPRRKTGTCAGHQRELAVALKRARHVALLPYAPQHLRP